MWMRMSRRIAVDQRRYAAGMADTQGWQFETCQATQEFRMRLKYARKFSFFTMRLLAYMCSYWGDRTDTGLCEQLWSILLNCQLMTKLEMMQTSQAQVCGSISAHPGLLHQKTKLEARDASKSQINQASWNRTILKLVAEDQSNVHISFKLFLWFSLDRSIWNKSRRCLFDWVCAAHIDYKSLVLKNTRITGIWIRKN